MTRWPFYFLVGDHLYNLYQRSFFHHPKKVTTNCHGGIRVDSVDVGPAVHLSCPLQGGLPFGIRWPCRMSGDLFVSLMRYACWVVVSNIFYFHLHPYLGKMNPFWILTNIFQMGWNHQPAWYFWHPAFWVGKKKETHESYSHMLHGTGVFLPRMP